MTAPRTTDRRLLPPRQAAPADPSIASVQPGPNRSDSAECLPIVDLFLAPALRINPWVYCEIPVYLICQNISFHDILLQSLKEGFVLCESPQTENTPFCSLDISCLDFKSATSNRRFTKTNVTRSPIVLVGSATCILL